MTTLFEDYIEELDPQKLMILSQKETDAVFDSLTTMFPFLFWGGIDWQKVKEKMIIDPQRPILDQVDHFLPNNFNDFVYILWNEEGMPAVETDTKDAISMMQRTLDYQRFDTWIFSPTKRYVIEFHHEGEIILGIAPNKETKGS